MKGKPIFWMALTATSVLTLTSVGVARTESTGNEEGPASIVEPIRHATQRYLDVDVAIADGYTLVPGCVSGPNEGAMGVHYAKLDLFNEVLDPALPEVLVYEPRHGRLRLVALEYIVPAAAWVGQMGQPLLMGHLLHYVPGPNRYGADSFYELHVWAWKHNPNGTFADWNPRVSCDEYSEGGAAPSSAHAGH